MKSFSLPGKTICWKVSAIFDLLVATKICFNQFLPMFSCMHFSSSMSFCCTTGMKSKHVMWWTIFNNGTSCLEFSRSNNSRLPSHICVFFSAAIWTNFLGRDAPGMFETCLFKKIDMAHHVNLILMQSVLGRKKVTLKNTHMCLTWFATQSRDVLFFAIAIAKMFPCLLMWQETWFLLTFIQGLIIVFHWRSNNKLLLPHAF